MSEKSTAMSRSYCSCCGWMDAGEGHDWDEHPATIHGTIEYVRKHRPGENDD
jgi:hypothetical protein